MTKYATSREVFRELSKLIELPKRCRSVTLTIAPDQIVEVTATYFPESGSGSGEPITQRFALSPIEEKPNG